MVSFITTTDLACILALIVIFLEWWLDRRERKHLEQLLVESTATSPFKSLTYWSSVTKKVLLGLSNTQLLTGIGIQLTALIDHCTLSIYHYWIAVNLAQLSTITHLMTTVALRHYFLEHARSSIIRVALILFNIALYLYQAFVADSLQYSNNVGDISQSLACYYQGNRPSYTKDKDLHVYWTTTLVLMTVLHAALLYTVFQASKKNAHKVWWKKWLLRLPVIIAFAYMVFAIVVIGADVLPNTQAIGTPLVVIDGSQKEWDFGQILPVYFWESQYLADGKLLGVSYVGPMTQTVKILTSGIEVHSDSKEHRKSEISNTISESVKHSIVKPKHENLGSDSL